MRPAASVIASRVGEADVPHAHDHAIVANMEPERADDEASDRRGDTDDDPLR